MGPSIVEPFAGTDRYVLQRVLGAGGMGVVYEALDRERNALVALKTVRRVNATAIARFKREFRGLAGAIHPNLVALYELVAEGEAVFFTMELVQGIHLHRWVRRLGPPAPTPDTLDSPSLRDETNPTQDTRVSTTSDSHDSTGASIELGELDIRRLRIALRQLAEGVAAIHDAGMLHRDLKPSNVLVTEDERVVILDFGLVTNLAEESMKNTEDRPLEGTAAFMSPEQGARMALTAASDWYSVGVMLHMALTGRPPFRGGRDDVLMDKQRFEPPAPSELVANVPPDLDALCVELMRRDPDRRPSTQEILRRLGSDAVPTRARTPVGTSHGAYSVLVGRDRHLARLDAALATTKLRLPSLAFVRGPSGMGKSRLVHAFVDGVQHQDDAVVLRGRCYEQESVPYKAVDGLIDSLSQYLAQLPQLEVEGLMPRDAHALSRVFPVLRQVEAITAERRREVDSPDPHELRRRAFAALRELLARLADRVSLLLVVDDLQWGDVDSAHLLSALLRPPDPPPLMLLASYRSEDREGSEFLNELEDQLSAGIRDVHHIDVGPLSPDEARELALLHLEDTPNRSAHANRIADESNGSPLFVEELSRHVRNAPGSNDTISLADVMTARLRRLPEPAARLLSTVAVATRPIERGDACRAAGVDDPAVLSLLKAGSFLRGRAIHGESYIEPYHDRVRETSIALLSPDQLRERHRRLAHVFESSPHPDPETLATHFRGAGLNERAAESAIAAAERAKSTLAFDRAARLYRAALESDPSIASSDLWMALGDALANAGRGAAAADAYLEAIEGATVAEQLDLHRRASEQLLYAGHIERGLASINEVLAAVNMRLSPTPNRALASLLYYRARLALRGLRFTEKDASEIPASELVRVDVTFAVTEGLGMADPMRAAVFQSRNLLLSLKCGEVGRIARALAAEAVFSSIGGTKTARRTAKIIEMLRPLAERVGQDGITGLAIGAEGVCAFQEGRFAETYDLCTRAAQIFRDRCTGYRWEMTTAHLFTSFSLALTGRVREMMQRFPSHVEEAYERGDLYAATTLRVSLGFYNPLAAGNVDEAYRVIDDAMSQWVPDQVHLQHANALNSRCFIDMYAGDPVRAFERCNAVWRDLERAFVLRAQIMRAILYGVRGRAALGAAVQTKDKAAARRAAKDARKLIREGPEHSVSQGLLLEAGLAHRRGDDARALELLVEGEQMSDRCGLKLNAVAAKRVRGQLVGGDEGAALVRAADEMMVGQGLREPDRIAALFITGFEDL